MSTSPISPLLDDTLTRLRALPRRVSLTHVAAETGLSLPWLSALARGIYKDPGVTKVQRLNDYLRMLPQDRDGL